MRFGSTNLKAAAKDLRKKFYIQIRDPDVVQSSISFKITHMRSIILFSLITLCLVCSNTIKVTAQSNQLNGHWKPVREEIGGSELPPASFEKQKLIISDSNYTFTAESVDKGIAVYKDGKMDIYGKDGVNKGKHFTAVYKFENELLLICYNLSGDKYPEAFDTKDKPTYFLATFKKE